MSDNVIELPRKPLKAKPKTNAERIVEAREALARARKLARQLELELRTARMALDDMTGEKMWLAQFWGGVLWGGAEAVREVGRRLFYVRRDTWETKW
jgi:hypothetical protein